MIRAEHLSDPSSGDSPTIIGRLSRLNWVAISSLMALCLIGVIMLYSAAGGSFTPWAHKQLLRLALGVTLMLLCSLVDIRTWMMWSYPLYIVSLLLLVAVELMGYIGMGAQRWINLGLFNLQPSELMRIAIVLVLARYFHNVDVIEARKLKSLVIPLILIIMPVILVLKQPDLGTAVILILNGVALFFVVGVQYWKFAISGASVLAAIPIIWNQMHLYQKKRVFAFINPESDPKNSGYHVIQSKIAIGSGGIFGKGFMQGTQGQLNFLPEKQTDFIFTMIAEEFGMLGGVVLVGLYMIIMTYGYKVAITTRHQFGRLVAFGMTTTVFLYAFINMAMVMGLLPVVGVPLPFVSYGGTALLTLLIGQGLIFSTAIHHDKRIGRL